MCICATRSVRHAVEVVVGIEIVVLRRDVNVVHVEQDAAVGALDDLGEEFPLGHLGDVELGVAADVFDADRDLEVVAHLADVLRGALRRGERVGHRQQVVRVAAVDAAPAEVVGEPGRLGALDERLQPREMLAVGPVGGAEVHRDAVLDDAVLLEDLVEHLAAGGRRRP